MKVKKQKINEIFQGPVHVRIGKEGVKKGVLREIANQLEHLKIIKVKVIGVDTKKEFLDLIADLEKRKLIQRLSTRGRTFVCGRGEKYREFLQ